MLTFDEVLHWIAVGFCIGVGLGIAWLCWILLRLLWAFLYYVWDELTDWEVKKYMKQFEHKSKSIAKAERE